eukprot:TRINITY_DN18976_c0_g1_i1.p1 TRINITY_DN18976_c0_g1~~TRINITY_DN18976_c0_g1_i1.p1  ORF type:complete len:474 (+),score=57.00 TRINITY_DN18976_c0_g1_i1:190-1422(+)
MGIEANEELQSDSADNESLCDEEEEQGLTKKPSHHSSMNSLKSTSSHGSKKRLRGSATVSVPVVCSETECAKVNFTMVSSRKKNAVTQIKYCGHCGCHLSLDEPDGVMQQLRTLRSQLNQTNELLLAKTAEMLKLEELLGYHKHSMGGRRRKDDSVSPIIQQNRAIRTGTCGKPVGNSNIETQQRRKRVERIIKKRIESDRKEHASQMANLRRKLYKDNGLELRRAAEHGITSVFQKLRKVDPELSGIMECTDHLGRTPIGLAAHYGHVAIVSICLQYEDPLNRVRSTDMLSKTGMSPIRSPDTFIYLCFPAYPGGPSLLHTASITGKISVLECIMDRFASDPKLEQLLFLKTKQGYTARNLAALYKFSNIHKYLGCWEDRFHKRTQQRALRLNGNFVYSPEAAGSPDSL